MQTLFAMAVDICRVQLRAKVGPALSLEDRARDRTVGGVRSRNTVGNKKQGTKWGVLVDRTGIINNDLDELSDAKSPVGSYDAGMLELAPNQGQLLHRAHVCR